MILTKMETLFASYWFHVLLILQLVRGNLQTSYKVTTIAETVYESGQTNRGTSEDVLKYKSISIEGKHMALNQRNGLFDIISLLSNTSREDRKANESEHTFHFSQLDKRCVNILKEILQKRKMISTNIDRCSQAQIYIFNIFALFSHQICSSPDLKNCKFNLLFIFFIHMILPRCQR